MSTMYLDEYQHYAMHFRKETATEEYAVLGLAGEVGELHSYLAKSIRDGYELDVEVMKKELGDVLWFVAAIADDCGLSLSDIAAGNLMKLSGRKQRGTIGGSGDDR